MFLRCLVYVTQSSHIVKSPAWQCLHCLISALQVITVLVACKAREKFWQLCLQQFRDLPGSHMHEANCNIFITQCFIVLSLRGIY